MTNTYAVPISDFKTQVLFPDWSIAPEPFVMTEADRLALDASDADFAAGRTFSIDDAEARITAFVAGLRSRRAV
jgi:hypothetical protein